ETGGFVERSSDFPHIYRVRSTNEESTTNDLPSLGVSPVVRKDEGRPQGSHSDFGPPSLRSVGPRPRGEFRDSRRGSERPRADALALVPQITTMEGCVVVAKKTIPVREAKDIAVEAVANGSSVKDAMALVSRSVKTWELWRKDDPHFRERVDRARAEHKRRMADPGDVSEPAVPGAQISF